MRVRTVMTLAKVKTEKVDKGGERHSNYDDVF